MSEAPSAPPPPAAAPATRGKAAAARRRRPGDRRRALRSRLVFPLFRLLPPLFAGLSWARAQRAGAALGELAWRISRRDRRRALEHLAIAFPERPPAEREAIGHAAFRHFGTMLGEGLHLARRSGTDLLAHVEVQGWDVIERLRAEGRRILVLSGHCGNWEIMTGGIPSLGLPLAVVARELQDSVLDELLVGLRGRFGAETIHRGAPGAARRLLSVLRSGGALGMLIDQDIRADSVFVPFFGRLAQTPVGAAQMALRHGLTVVPAFIERRADGSHLMRFLSPLELPADPTAATALMTAAIEAQVRRRPEQWVWMHRRWRRQPPPDGAPPSP